MTATTAMAVTVDVCTGWTAPDAPRDMDRAALASHPDIPGWLAALDAAGPEGRLGLHGRTLTQLERGEPAVLLEEAGEWVRVLAPWQPSALDPRGYPVWVRRDHLAPSSQAARGPSANGVEADRAAVLEAARLHLGLEYLWGGTSPYGLDCSGLVHHCYRRAGLVVPRDAHDQWQAAEAVPLGTEQPGDLYFFAREDGIVFHVGFVSGQRSMLHAPESGRLIEDAPLTSGRLATLLAVGRFRT